MEKQSATQHRSDVVMKIKENINYFYIVLMLLANVILNLLVIEDGSIGTCYPSTTLGWILWAVRLVLQTLIGCLILNSFRRQGIKLGHENEDVKKVYKEYLDAIRRNSKQMQPRSLKQYLSTHGARDTASKSIVYVATTILIGSMIIGANTTSLIALVVNIIMSIAFGLKAMMDAEHFVITELIIWYQLKTAEVTDQKLEPAKELKEDDRRIQGNASGTGLAEPSGIQPQEECPTGPTNIDSVEPSQRNTNPEA